MTQKHLTVDKLIALMTISLSSTVFAAGSHTGGHGHVTEATEIGKIGEASRVGRTITIEMNDSMRYAPAFLQVTQGETVRLIIKNVGKVKHELSLGAQKELMEHHEYMKKFPDLEHDDPSKITLKPGKQGEIIWQFTKAGTVDFACLIPGHYEAGMKGSVRVTKRLN